MRRRPMPSIGYDLSGVRCQVSGVVYQLRDVR